MQKERDKVNRRIVSVGIRKVVKEIWQNGLKEDNRIIFFFASTRWGGGCERTDEICFFPDLEETGDVLRKEKIVKVSESTIKKTLEAVIRTFN